ncbi:MAG: peptidoglycan DD-metalloendopeptidase family protein [Alistipes sp.]|nr:peptidoglycan DD-metalloendopeptidase family protein [Alistipes sp.]
MRRYFIRILPALLLSGAGCLPVAAQEAATVESAVQTAAVSQGVARAPKDYYRMPMDVPTLLSANFAEARPDHFHSGIDLKTGGVEGEPIYAVADGYISRVFVSHSGYGRALYVVHPNGTTSVYGHMQRFEPEVEEYVNSERHRQRRHNVDLYPGEERFPVVRGQQIGLLGNSGSSFGPHLHFEIRDTPSQRVHNIPRLGFYDIRDNIPPMLVRLHYIAVDTLNSVPVSRRVKTYELASAASGVYYTADTSALRLPRNGYFVLEATDRKNNTHNTMGIYGVDMEIDGDQVFGYRLDSFLFGETRYVNSYTHYGMQKGSRNELLRLAVQDGNRLSVYRAARDRGAIYLTDDEVHNVRITAWDDSGNSSVLTLKVRRNPDDAAPGVPEGIPVDHRRAFSRSTDGLHVTIPANSLYEPVYYRQHIDHPAASVPTANMRSLVPVYRIHDADIPLHTAMTVTIDLPGDIGETDKLCIARVSDDGKRYSYVGGKYSAGRITADTRSFGLYTVVRDVKAPAVTPSFANGADLRGRDSFSFNISDDFSGIAYYTGEIDGQWIVFERKGAVITHNFDTSTVTYDGREHTLTLRVTDNCGNTASVSRTFVR